MESQEPLCDHRHLFLTHQKQASFDSLRKSPTKAEQDENSEIFENSSITSSNESNIDELMMIEPIP